MEAAFLVPIILMIISVTITLLFYYHDKVILRATLHETVAVMSRKEELTEEVLEQYYRKQIGERLLLFPVFQVETQIEEGELTMMCCSEYKGMKICAEARMKRTSPETWVRTINKVIGE